MKVKINFKNDFIEFDNAISYKIEDSGLCINFEIDCYRMINEYSNICITSKFEVDRNELIGIELLSS